MTDRNSEPERDASILRNSPTRPAGEHGGFRPFRSPQALGVTTMTLIGLVMVADIGLILQTAQLKAGIDEYVAGRRDLDLLGRADRLLAFLDQLTLLATILAGVLFICWTWRVRRNAEFFTDAKHQHRIGWVIGGWFCPIVNLWFPCHVLSDIHAASSVRTAPTGDWLGRTRGGNFVIFWWLSLLLSSLVARVALSQATSSTTPEALQTALSTYAVSCALNVVAGFLALRLISNVNTLQLSRPPIPWWSIQWPQPQGDPAWPQQSPPPTPWPQTPPERPAGNTPQPQTPPQAQPSGTPPQAPPASSPPRPQNQPPAQPSGTPPQQQNPPRPSNPQQGRPTGNPPQARPSNSPYQPQNRPPGNPPQPQYRPPEDRPRPEFPPSAGERS